MEVRSWKLFGNIIECKMYIVHPNIIKGMINVFDFCYNAMYYTS